MWQELVKETLYDSLPKILGRLVYTYQHKPSGSDEASGQSWQLVTAICDEGDGLTLCEQIS
jgi:hypothetical protein